MRQPVAVMTAPLGIKRRQLVAVIDERLHSSLVALLDNRLEVGTRRRRVVLDWDPVLVKCDRLHARSRSPRNRLVDVSVRESALGRPPDLGTLDRDADAHRRRMQHMVAVPRTVKRLHWRRLESEHPRTRQVDGLLDKANAQNGLILAPQDLDDPLLIRHNELTLAFTEPAESRLLVPKPDRRQKRPGLGPLHAARILALAPRERIILVILGDFRLERNLKPNPRQLRLVSGRTRHKRKRNLHHAVVLDTRDGVDGHGRRLAPAADRCGPVIRGLHPAAVLGPSNRFAVLVRANDADGAGEQFTPKRRDAHGERIRRKRILPSPDANLARLHRHGRPWTRNRREHHRSQQSTCHHSLSSASFRLPRVPSIDDNRRNGIRLAEIAAIRKRRAQIDLGLRATGRHPSCGSQRKHFPRHRPHLTTPR